MIDLEEFERRLREPLAELDRLIGEKQDSFQSVTEPQRQCSAEAGQDTLESGERKQPDAMDRLIGGDLASVEPGLLDARRERAMADLSGAGESLAGHSEPVAQKWLVSGDFGSIVGATEPIAAATSSEAKEPKAHGLLSSDENTMVCQGFGAAKEAIGSRRPPYVLIAIIIAGTTVIAASFGFRSGASRPPEIATISESGSAKPQLGETDRSGVPAPDTSNVVAAPQLSPGTDAEQPVDPLQAREIAPAERIAASPEQLETQVGPPSQTVSVEPEKMNTASVGPHDAILSGDTPPRATAEIVPLPVPRRPAVAKVANRAKPKRPASTVTAQPMQATDSQGGGREPDALGDLLRRLFGTVP
jgi:hypothetical protein